MELIVANTCFKRQKKLATCVSGSTVSTIDYLLLSCDRRFIRNVKVIAGEECITAWVTCGWYHYYWCNVAEKENIHAKAESVEVEEGVQTTDKISVSLEVKGQNGFCE